MSSSESARVILFAVWFVGTLIATSAQLRVIAVEPPRRRRYLVAWLACALIGGALLSAVDALVGRTDWPRRFGNVALAAVVAAAALGAGAWLAGRPEWRSRLGVVRFLALVVLQAAVVGIVSYPFF